MSAALLLEEAQARLLALVTPLPVERVDIGSALGRYLAEPLIARRIQPAADLSAMDGYAVRGPDISGPWRVVGESAAGHPCARAVGTGQAVRIATGALMPQGADAVVMQEDVARTGDIIILIGTAPAPPGKHIRRCGGDFRQGAVLLPMGTRLGPAQLALVISAGHNHVAVRRMPRLAIIDSGDELATDAENCDDHQIPASNGAMLAALAASLPCDITRLGPITDDMAAITQTLEAAAGADVIVTSGGASVGDHDLIRPALAEWEAKLDFWKVAIKPGKPLMVATKSRQIVLGLPGNPVSSHVTAFLFLMPLLRALSGAARPLAQATQHRLAAPVPAGGDRREFLRARMTDDGAEVLATQDSGALAALALADLLIDRPAGAPPLPAGAIVPAYFI